MELRKELNLFELTLCGVGIILGAGIYVLVGKAAGLAGNGIWLSFLLAAIATLPTGLSYAELSSTFPKAGAEYTYARIAFGKEAALLVGLLVLVSGVTSASAVALGFAGYLRAFIGYPKIFIAISLFFLLLPIILYGVRESAWFGILFTFLETFGLILVIAAGMFHLGEVNYFEYPNLLGVFTGASLIFFAYVGFQTITRLAEETKEAKKNIPRAILLSILITTVLYVLVGISAVSIVSWKELARSEKPLGDVMLAALGKKAYLLLNSIALVSTLNTVLFILLSISRIAYGMARERGIPSLLAYVHPKTRTPWLAILFITLVSALLVLTNNLSLLASVSNFAIFLVFALVNATVVWLRRHKPVRTAYATPSLKGVPVLAIFGILINVFMIFNLSSQALFYGPVLTVFLILFIFLKRVRWG